MSKYTVKAFKPFEFLHEPADSLDAAQQRFEQLCLGGQHDAVYVHDEQGQMVVAWAANYDEPEGGHDEALGYLRRVGRVEVRLAESRTRSVGMLGSESGVFVFVHPDHGLINYDYGVFLTMHCNLDAAKTINGLLNQLEVMCAANRAAREALAAADVDFARLVLVDAGEIEDWRWAGKIKSEEDEE